MSKVEINASLRHSVVMAFIYLILTQVVESKLAVYGFGAMSAFAAFSVIRNVWKYRKVLEG